jgi:creatinine amidohydrolase
MTASSSRTTLLFYIFLLVICLTISIACDKEKSEVIDSIQNYSIEYMNPSEFKSMADGISIAYVPIGVIEWHNEHLPLGYDTIKAYELCKRIRDKTGGAIYPPIYLGTNGIGKIGRLDIPQEFAESIFREVIQRLIDQGFRIIVTLTGHTPQIQIEILKKIAAEMESKNPYIKVIPLTEGTFVHDEEIQLFGHYQDHAAAGETSLLLATRPELVHLEKLKYPIKPKKEGVLWDPRYGSVKNGEKIVNLIVERSAKFILSTREELYTKYPTAPKNASSEEPDGASILDEMQ